MRRRGLLWLGVVALLVLATRWLTYALTGPSPLTTRFEASAGGARFVVVTLVSLGLAAAVSLATLWLAVLGVRERQRLRPERELPRIRLRRLALRAIVLTVAGSLAFALFESWLHWRAGLGFHGLSCLFGPVHRNALPLLAALSLLAAALAEAVAHLYAWMRATARALLTPAIELLWATVPFALPPGHLSPAPLLPWARPRAPPLPA
jgi:hypothetical protein